MINARLIRWILLLLLMTVPLHAQLVVSSEIDTMQIATDSLQEKRGFLKELSGILLLQIKREQIKILILALLVDLIIRVIQN